MPARCGILLYSFRQQSDQLITKDSVRLATVLNGFNKPTYNYLCMPVSVASA